MADEYVVASLAAGACPQARPAPAWPASPPPRSTRAPQAQLASLTASALTTGSATPALIASFAIEVLQSIAGPPNRRRDTIVVC
jgi:hypothetical protein